MPTDLPSMWSLLSPIIIGVLAAIIPQVVKDVGDRRDIKSAQNHNLAAQTRTVNLLKIEQREPSNSPPKSLSIIPLASSFIMLGFGGVVLYMLIARIIRFQMDLFWGFLFPMAFIVIPLIIIADYFHTKCKYYKLGRSRVAKEAKITIANDADTVFDSCYRALDSMRAAIRIMEKPNLLRANIRNCVMTIRMIQIEGCKVIVYILSDSKWLTIKWDGGANQRNIDDFLQELSKLYNSSIYLPS